MMEQYLTNKELQKMFTAFILGKDHPIFRDDKKILEEVARKLRLFSYYSNDDDQTVIKLIHPENA